MRVGLQSNGGYWQARCKGHPARSLGSKANISRRKAEVLCRQWEFELRSAAVTAHPEPLQMTVPSLSKWLDRCESQRTALSKGTRYVNKACAIYLKRHFDHDPRIDRIDRQQAADWRAALASGELSKDNERITEAPGEQSVCKYVRAARKIFAEAVKQEVLKSNPFDRLDSVPPDAVRDWAYIDAAAMRNVYDACPDDAWRALFGLLRFAGLRRGEAFRLRWTDVDFARNRLTVNAPGTIARVDTKHRTRIVPIEPLRCPSGLTRLLEVALEAAKDGAIRVVEQVPAGTANVRAVKIVTAGGVARYPKIFHTLRKNCEMDWAAQYPQHVVSEWAGHSISVSATHYLRVPEELYERASAKSQPAQTPSDQPAPR